MVGAVLVLLATLDAPSDPPVPIIQGGKSAEEVVSEGLTFYAEGDYQRAASWLGLVALAAPHLSAAADFALADMYERGLGVPQDVRRAYALYLHAGTSTADSYDLQQLGRAALARLTRELSADDERAATLLATRGFRDGLVSQWLPVASGGVLELTPDHLALQDGPTLHEEEWGQFSMVFERISMHEPGPAGPGQRDLLEVLFWVTSAEGAAVGRTLIWRVYVVDRGGIAIACETPLLVTRGLLVLFSPSMAEDLRAKARLIVRRDGTYACAPGPAR